MAPDDPWTSQRKLLGDFIRTQRRLANLSLREMAARTAVSNPYLSQIERGLHEPSVRVLKAIAAALNVSSETLMAQAGLLADKSGGGVEDETTDTAAAIRADTVLSDAQKTALLAVYHSYRDANVDKERVDKERVDKERVDKERIDKERIDKERVDKGS
jgi:transcriptional regulator with XRE-family HTH domain